LLTYIWHKLTFYFSKFIPKLKTRQSFNLRNAYYYSTILALIPVFCIGFQSVGSLGFYELGLIIIFEILGIFYIRKKVIS
jgi:hypothetical protein